MNQLLLHITDPLTRSPLVTRLQEALVALGYDLGRWGIDGAYGEDTASAVAAFQRGHELEPTSVVDTSMWQRLEQAMLRHPPIIDRRSLHPPPRLYSRGRSPRRWKADGRSGGGESGSGTSVIRGVTLHQTGILVGERPSRWDSLNAHIAVLRSGDIIVVNALEDFIWHAQGLSASTIGIEFNGNFAGIEDDPSTVWSSGGGPHALSEAQLAAADRLFDWLRAEFSTHGGTWERVHAHRQATSSRRSDPGSEIWQKIALPWIERLGPMASDGGPDFKMGDGRPIPRAWNPRYSTAY